MIIVGIYNIKGGVGKTASSVNLSYLSARSGRKTLLWDLDPQGSSTYYYHIKQGINASTKKVFTGKADLDDLIKPTEFENLSLLPSDFSFRNLDVMLDDVKRSKKRLAEALEPIKNSFDLIFLDCPPGISLLSENIFHAVDILLVPIIPTPLSLRTYDQIIKFYQENNLDDSNIIPFFSMVEQRKKLHRESIEGLSKTIPRICRNAIPYLSDIEKMGLYRKPLPVHLPGSQASRAYIALWEELKPKLDKLLKRSANL